MKVLFVPDVFKYEEEFIIHADTLSDAIDILISECYANCAFSIYVFGDISLDFCGVIVFEEDKTPVLFCKNENLNYFN